MKHRLSLEFSNGLKAGISHPVKINFHEGFESLEAAANVIDYAMRDGGYIASIRATTRRITLDLSFHGEYAWADLAKLFPLKVPLGLLATRDGRTRRLTVYRDGKIIPLGGRGATDVVQCQVSFLATSPYMLGDEVELAAAGVLSGGLEYPITYPITLDNLAYVDHIDVRNDGDYPAGFTFDLIAAAEIAAMTLGVGRDTMTFKAIHTGQRLTVDTAMQTIRIDGENGFALLESGPFLKIPTGESSIWFGAFSGSATVEFTPIYEGV